MQSKSRRMLGDLEQSARQVWLAGLGVYAYAEETGSDLVGRLARRGRDVQDAGEHRVERVESWVEGAVRSARQRLRGAVDGAGDRLEGGVEHVLHRFGVPTRRDLAALTRRVERLSSELDLAAPAAGGDGARKRVLHVTVHDDGWKVAAEGSETPLSTHPRKSDAVAEARRLGERRAPARVVVHRMDGTIQTHYSYEATSH